MRFWNPSDCKEDFSATISYCMTQRTQRRSRAARRGWKNWMPHIFKGEGYHLCLCIHLTLPVAVTLAQVGGWQEEARSSVALCGQLMPLMWQIESILMWNHRGVCQTSEANCICAVKHKANRLLLMTSFSML